MGDDIFLFIFKGTVFVIAFNHLRKMNMSHSINRIAFLSAQHCGHPLLSVYGQLVATELALKDYAGAWSQRKGHDIPAMLDDWDDPGLTALSAQLREELSVIPCTNNLGNAAVIAPAKYPELRYARLVGDYENGVADEQLVQLATVVGDIILQLRNKGVAI